MIVICDVWLIDVLSVMCDEWDDVCGELFELGVCVCGV